MEVLHIKHFGLGIEREWLYGNKQCCAGYSQSPRRIPSVHEAEEVPNVPPQDLLPLCLDVSY